MDIYSRCHAVLQLYAPAEVQYLDFHYRNTYAGREPEMIVDLVQRYGPEPIPVPEVKVVLIGPPNHFHVAFGLGLVLPVVSYVFLWLVKTERQTKRTSWGAWTAIGLWITGVSGFFLFIRIMQHDIMLIIVEVLCILWGVAEVASGAYRHARADDPSPSDGPLEVRMVSDPIWEQKLHAFYQKHSPCDIPMNIVGKIIASGKGESEVLPALFTKYNLSPGDRNFWIEWEPRKGDNPVGHIGPLPS